MKAIQTENLTKFYGKRRGIENVSLTVEEGDFFGFIGPNGAGKSTTIRTLTGLLFPSSGSAEIFGKGTIESSTFFPFKNESIHIFINKVLLESSIIFCLSFSFDAIFVLKELLAEFNIISALIIPFELLKF